MLLRKKIYFIVALSVHENFYDAAKAVMKIVNLAKMISAKTTDQLPLEQQWKEYQNIDQNCAYELTQYKLLLC